MSWETVEALPGSGGGGAFREGAEPVVAERAGVGPVERLRLFWHSTPEHPLARTAERVVVTPRHVYVQRQDGSRARAPLDALHGERLEHRRVIYGVRDGDDLLLPYRDRCPVQVRLAAAVRAAEPVEPWRDTQWLVTSLVLSLGALGLGFGLLASYPIDRAIEVFGAGFLSSETVLGSVAACGACALGVSLFLWGPSRWRVDAVAVTRTRGVIPWLAFSIPPERVRRAVLVKTFAKPKRGAAYHAGWRVGLELREPTRVGTLSRTRRLDLDLFSFAMGAGRAASKPGRHQEARALAERLRGLLSLEPTAEL